MPCVLLHHVPQSDHLISQSEQDLQQKKPHYNISGILTSHKPHTLHVQQRHQACVDRSNKGITVAKKHRKCKVLLNAVVLGLGVIVEGAPAVKKEVSTSRSRRMTEEAVAGRKTMTQTKKRSAAERRRWLGEVEQRIVRAGRYTLPQKQVDSLDESSEEDFTRRYWVRQNHEGRRLPGSHNSFEERWAADKEQRVRETSIECAAAVHDRLLRSSLPEPPSERLNEVSLASHHDDRALSQDGNYSQSHTSRPVPGSRAITKKRSTHRILNDLGLFVLSKCHLTRAKTVLRGREKALLPDEGQKKGKGKERSQSSEKKSLGCSGSSRSQNSKVARATTSGLPAEITAGFFTAENSTAKGQDKEIKHWWDNVRHSRTMRSVKRLADENEATEIRQKANIGCAPGPSSRMEVWDDPFEQEHNFCSSCSPSSLDKGSRKAKTVESRSKKCPITQPPGATRSHTYRPPPGPLKIESSPATLKSSEPSSNLAPMASSPCTNNIPFPPPHNVRSHHSLPRTPRYGMMKPLLGQIHEILSACDSTTGAITTSNGESRTPLQVDKLVVDEEAIWIECSERPDHVSDTAAMNARASIRKDRDETIAEELQHSNDLVPDGLRRAHSVEVLGLGTAEMVQSQRIRMQDVDVIKVTSEKPERAKDHTDYKPSPMENSTQGKASDAASKGPPTTTRNLGSTMTQIRRPLHLPWEGVWHNESPKMEPIKRVQTPSEYSAARSNSYSLREAMQTDDEDDTVKTSSKKDQMCSALPWGTQRTIKETPFSSYRKPPSSRPLQQRQSPSLEPQSLDAAIVGTKLTGKEPKTSYLLCDESAIHGRNLQSAPRSGIDDADDAPTASTMVPAHVRLTSSALGGELGRSPPTVAVLGAKLPVVRHASASPGCGDAPITAAEQHPSSIEPLSKARERLSPKQESVDQVYKGEKCERYGRDCG